MKTLLPIVAFAALGGCTLVGCRSGYDVDVRNLADQPVTVTLNVPFGDGAGKAVASRRLGPGDRGNLFTQQGSSARVYLEADFAGNVGYPATVDLVRGKTVLNVKRADEGSKGKLMIEEVQRP